MFKHAILAALLAVPTLAEEEQEIIKVPDPEPTVLLKFKKSTPTSPVKCLSHIVVKQGGKVYFFGVPRSLCTVFQS